MSWLEFLDSSGIANCVTKSLTMSLSLSWSYHVSSRSHWKKKTHLENSDIIKQGPRVRVCTSLTQEVRVTSHLRSIHVLPVQQHHHVLLFNNILINFTILSLIYINFKILSTQWCNHQLTRLIDIITIFIVTIIIIIIITRSKPAYDRQGIVGASSAQLGSGKWSFFVTDRQTNTSS